MSDNIQYEEWILTHLGKFKQLRSLMSEVVILLKKNLNQLTVNLLSKQEHAEKFVLPALIGSDGPFNDHDLQLKLLYALGIINLTTYEDISLIIVLSKELNTSKLKYNYTDEIIINALEALHSINIPPNFYEMIEFVNTSKDKSSLESIEHKIRLLLILGCTSIILKINA